MQQKFKICDGCNKERPIWKSSGTGGLKLCKQCWSAHSKNNTQKPTSSVIPRVSAKKAKQDIEYLKLRERFLTENPVCQINVAGCTRYVSEVHHTYSGSDRAVYYLIQSTFRATCRNCHQHIHLFPAEAREMGWLK